LLFLVFLLAGSLLASRRTLTAKLEVLQRKPDTAEYNLAAPRRRDGYERKTTSYAGKYDEAWTKGGYPAQSCWGCRFVKDVIRRLESTGTPIRHILDAGTGNCALVRKLRNMGLQAVGIELSEEAMTQSCPDLLKEGFVESGSLTSIPYEDNSFDLVFSSDVLEHISPQEAEDVVREMVRVSRKDIFLSISLKSHTKVSATNNSEAFRHTLLRPRSWWHHLFERHGARVNHNLLLAMQEADIFTKGRTYDCRSEGDSRDGGEYEVCVINSTWLVGEPQQGNVREDRCIATASGELEPWFFAFTV